MRRMIGLSAFIVVLALLFASLLAGGEAQKPSSRSSSQSTGISPEEANSLERALWDNDLCWGSPGDAKERLELTRKRQRIRDLIHKMSDEQFEQFLVWQLPAPIDMSPDLDYGLSEAIRRGGPRQAAFLESRNSVLGGIYQSYLKREPPWDKFVLCNVETLTALRRVQKQNDPLLVVLSDRLPRRTELGHTLELPVSLVNVDGNRAPVILEEGGDYRSGRQTKWRIQVWDANGRLLPERGQLDPHGGGFVKDEMLNYGESWTTSLDLAKYVDIDAPGEYRAQVLYHNRIGIADLVDVEGLIVCTSVPFAIVVDTVRVESTDQAQADIADWVSRLPMEGPTKMAERSYIVESNSFIAPDSPAGRLLRAGWAAAPDLIQAAIAPETPPQRRAWDLAILYSITGLNDPRSEVGVLGAYKYRSIGTWESSPGGSIAPKKQLEFARRWKDWLDKEYVKIEKKPASAPAK